MTRERKSFWWLVHPEHNRASGKWATARKALKHKIGDYENAKPVKAKTGMEAMKSLWTKSPSQVTVAMFPK